VKPLPARTRAETLRRNALPGVAEGLAAIASSQRPDAERMAERSSCRFASSHGSGESVFIAACAARSFGRTDAGSRGSYARSASARRAPTASPPLIRDHDVSIPSNGSAVAGSPSRRTRSFVSRPRRSDEPKPWLLCWLRLSAAVSVYDRPRKGL
jgi:hypothetical protein